MRRSSAWSDRRTTAQRRGRGSIADPALNARVDRILTWLVEEGAAVSASLIALLVALESDARPCWSSTWWSRGWIRLRRKRLMAHLRRRGPGARPLFLLTRSCAILELAAVGADETIILCPANHSPPTQVAPYPGGARL